MKKFKKNTLIEHFNPSYKTPYVFWLYLLQRSIWSLKPLLRKNVMKCTVDGSAIEFAGTGNDGPLRIPIASIKKCSINQFLSSFSNKTVTIKLFNDRPVHILFTHPLKPNQPQYTDEKEAQAFVKIVNGLMSGERVSINPNPYLRAFEYMGKQPEPAVEIWDPNVNPWDYYRKYHKIYTTKEIIGYTILVIILLGAFVLVFGLAADALLN